MFVRDNREGTSQENKMPHGYMIKYFGFVLASQMSFFFLNLNTVKKKMCFNNFRTFRKIIKYQWMIKSV